jgi:hypothetical protein
MVHFLKKNLWIMKEDLEKLLRNNKIPELFERLRQILSSNPKLRNKTILLQSRFNDIEEKRRGGVADSAWLTTAYNCVKEELLEVINQLPPAKVFAATPNSEGVPPTVKSNSKPMYWALVGLLFMVTGVVPNLINRTQAPTDVSSATKEKLEPKFEFEVEGTYHDKIGGTSAITRRRNDLTVKLDNGRPIAKGVIIDGNSIRVEYTDHRTMHGTLVKPNRIEWTDNSVWYRD